MYVITDYNLYAYINLPYRHTGAIYLHKNMSGLSGNTAQGKSKCCVFATRLYFGNIVYTNSYITMVYSIM